MCRDCRPCPYRHSAQAHVRKLPAPTGPATYDGAMPALHRATAPEVPPALADSEGCYRALQARDARFDGQFFTGVTSTGIYCRPGLQSAHCPGASQLPLFRTGRPGRGRGFSPLPTLPPGAGASARRRPLRRVVGSGCFGHSGGTGRPAARRHRPGTRGRRPERRSPTAWGQRAPFAPHLPAGVRRWPATLPTHPPTAVRQTIAHRHPRCPWPRSRI